MQAVEINIPGRRTAVKSPDVDSPSVAGTDRSTLEAALDLARRGCYVFPVHTIRGGVCTCGGQSNCKPGKHPATRNGDKAASTDPRKIRRMWKHRADANIGVDLARSHLVSVSSDSPHWLREFQERGLPPTATYSSGGGEGHLHHLYYRTVGCATGRVCVSGEYDVMSSGYVVVPPSAHESGRVYTWLASLTNVADLPEAPVWAVEMLRPQASVSMSPAVESPQTRSDEEVLGRARAARNGAKFEELWAGGLAGHKTPSEGDLSLCEMLAKWTDGCKEQIDRLFRGSGRMRDKWDTKRKGGRSTYGSQTIDLGIEGWQKWGAAVMDTPPEQPEAAFVPENATQNDLLEQYRKLAAEHTALKKHVSDSARVLCDEDTLPAHRIAIWGALNLYRSDVSRGRVYEDGYVPMPAMRLSDATGLKPSTCSRIIPRILPRIGGGYKVPRVKILRDDDTGAIREIPIETWMIRPVGTDLAAIHRAMRLSPDTTPKAGGKRLFCAEHPDAGTRTSWRLECAVCGKLLQAGITKHPHKGETPTSHNETREIDPETGEIFPLASQEMATAAQPTPALEPEAPLGEEEVAAPTRSVYIYSGSHYGVRETQDPTADAPAEWARSRPVTGDGDPTAVAPPAPAPVPVAPAAALDVPPPDATGLQRLAAAVDQHGGAEAIAAVRRMDLIGAALVPAAWSNVWAFQPPADLRVDQLGTWASDVRVLRPLLEMLPPPAPARLGLAA